jgi:hypothetical protein
LAADGLLPIPPEPVLLALEADPVPPDPVAVAGALGALPVVPLLPEPDIADLSCTLPDASLQCVAAETFALPLEAPDIEEPLD